MQTRRELRCCEVTVTDASSRKKRRIRCDATFLAATFLVTTFLVVFVVALLLTLTACEEQKAPPASGPPEVDVVQVIQQDVPIYEGWVAQINGPVNAEITPKVQGYLLKQNYQNGHFVRKGQLLFETDPRPFQAALDGAKADLAAPDANLARTEADVARDTPLAVQNAIPLKQLDNDLASQAAFKARVQAQKAAVKNAKLNLGWTRIYSPIDGIAGVSNSQIGDLVGTATKMATVSQVNPIWTYCNVSETVFLRIAPKITRILRGTSSMKNVSVPAVEFIQADGVPYPKKGKIIYVNRQVGTQTGTIQMAAECPTVEADKEILRINAIKFKGRESSIQDVYQAELLVQQAEAQVISLQQAIEQSESQISILLGRNPGPIARGLNLVEQPHLPEVPTGLPSAVLQRRPDVRQAEETLVAANANVGVAKAAFFPQLSLTGAFGAQSTSLASFLNGPATFWAAGGQAVQPFFQGGRIRSSYRLAWAQRDEAELLYKQTVQQAFGDVSNSLVGYHQSRQFLIKLQERAGTYGQAANLATVRFQGGVTAFLEVLVTEQQYFTSERALAQAWFTEMQNYVQLYQAPGGGWQP